MNRSGTRGVAAWLGPRLSYYVSRMGLRDVTDRKAVELAVAEYDSIGSRAFLAKYGFRRARGYVLVADGRRYDSKAIIGAAHGYQHGAPLNAEDFSGGLSTVVDQLQRLGFEVTRSITSPDWVIDELMLALDLYLRTRDESSYSPRTPAVVALSDELRALTVHAPEIRNEPRFRNPNSVALKLHNFAALDPMNSGRGMSHGGAADRTVWSVWSRHPDELRRACELIRSNARPGSTVPETGEDEEFSAVEGRVLYRLHRRYERDPELVRRKKAAVRRKEGKLACEICAFDSEQTFGVVGVVDVHHIAPLHQIGESATSLSALAVVCPTCHRTLHKHHPLLSPGELRKVMLERRASEDTG